MGREFTMKHVMSSDLRKSLKTNMVCFCKLIDLDPDERQTISLSSRASWSGTLSSDPQEIRQNLNVHKPALICIFTQIYPHTYITQY